ncbi:MAG: endonuclease/exonuclease/phosphatase family protein [Acidimicrobiales bacterium]
MRSSLYQRREARVVRVVTWNIQIGRPNPDGPPDIGRVVDCLASLHADVHALQELDRGQARSGRIDQPAVIADALDGQVAFAPTVQRGGGGYGIGIVVRGDILATEVVALSGTREPRALLIADVDVGGRRWAIGCTHLSRHRELAGRQLLRVFDALATRPAPRVLVGDLNLTPREVLPWSTAEGYHLVDGSPTHSTRQPEVTRRIDHVLLSGAIATGATVHRFTVSDHRAVSADLT